MHPYDSHVVENSRFVYSYSWQQVCYGGATVAICEIFQMVVCLWTKSELASRREHREENSKNYSSTTVHWFHGKTSAGLDSCFRFYADVQRREYVGKKMPSVLMSSSSLDRRRLGG